MSKSIVISCGPIPSKLDSVKYITNRFKGGLAAKTVGFFVNKGYDVTVIKWKYSELDFACESSPNVIDVDDVYEYYNWFCENAKNYDAFIMAAAVANLTPVEPFEGKFPSHLYREGEEFSLNFKIAPRAIDVIKKLNPKAFLVGYKLYDAKSDEELVEIAKHTLEDSKANIIFANTPKNAKSRKIALLQDDSVIPMTFNDHLEFINKLFLQEYFSTTIIDPEQCPAYRDNKDKIEMAFGAVKMFEQSIDKFGSIAIKITDDSFVTTSRGHKGEPVFVEKVDVKNRKVYASAKATLNAPAMYAVLQKGYDFAFHRHDAPESKWCTYKDYVFPGTIGEYYKIKNTLDFYCFSMPEFSLTEPFHGTIAGLRLTGVPEQILGLVRHIIGKNLSPEFVDWDRYDEIFPKKYMRPIKQIDEVLEKYKGKETLELGGNHYSTTKYVFDPFISKSDTAEMISLSFLESHKFDLIVCKNSINYLSESRINMALDSLAEGSMFIANTFDGAPKLKITENEVAFSNGMVVYHYLVHDGHLYFHKFDDRNAEWYEKRGFTVEKYGKNSLIVSVKK